jgi:sugar/nucleoside kinase (ribokinase family)
MKLTYLSLGGIILDDIVFSDGRTAMNFLGGGGVYAAAGMRLWSNQVGLWSRVGPDFDFTLLEPLDLAVPLIQVTPLQTPRAWQLYEEDGSRTQIPRIPAEVWRAQLMASPADLPPLDGIQGAHLAIRGHAAEPEVVTQLVEAGLVVSLEPIVDAATTTKQRQTIFESVRMAHIFSPGQSDGQLLLGPGSTQSWLKKFAEMGPQLVLLRKGAAGSLIYERAARRTWQVPAAATQVVDVTGGGNAYCGGFLVGWLEHGNIPQAAARAAVSAALTLEQVGPPAISPARLAEAEQRLIPVLQQIKPTEA